jgi:diguanylate cyclase (GGDEF)-like protein/PAS domain S-box-containing protein
MAALAARLAACAALALSLCASAQPLRVVTADNYPPYVYRNPDGAIEGYEVDLWHLWERKTGKPVVLTATNWAEAQRVLLSGKADVIDLIFRTPAREGLYDFSPPFAEVTTAIYTDASISGIHDVANLRGFEVGVQEGDACAETLLGAGIASVHTYPTNAALMAAVSNRNVKIFCLDDYPASYYLYRLGLQRTFVRAFGLYRSAFHRAVRKGNATTLAVVDRGMALISEPERAALRAKWMGQALVGQQIGRQAGEILFALALVILGLVAWLVTVRKAVRSRTTELEREKAQWRGLVENSPDLIWLKDDQGIYRACNQAGERLFGKAKHDIIGKSDFDLFDAAAAARNRERDSAALHARVPLASEERLVFPATGLARLFETIRTPILNASGALLGVLGVARDISERRRQEQTIREQSELLREMSALARIGAWEVDLASGHVVWTDEAARIHGLEPGDRRDLATFLSCLHGEARVQFQHAFDEAISTGQPSAAEFELTSAAGTGKWVRAICRPVLEEGKAVKVRGTLQDVSERRKLEQSMLTANLIYQSSSEAIALTDEANRVVDANPAYLEQMGVPADEVIGKPPAMFGSVLHDASFYQRIANELAASGHWQGEVWDHGRGGELVARSVNIRVIRHPDGRLYRHVLQFHDITEQKQKDELIWRHTNFDVLTGLPNRRLLLDRLKQAIRKAHAAGAGLGLMFIDLDRFKAVNDAYGREAGDRAMLEVSQRLARAIPETACLGRLEGDRFGVVLGGADQHVQMETVAAAVIAAVGQPIPLEQGQVAYVSAGVGIALYPDDGDQAEELIKNAEHAVYLAKRAGRGRFTYFKPSLQREAQLKLMLTNDLRQALARKELCVHYQPIVEAASGRIRKAEALLRWMHPTYGLIGPARFIPLAEESGLILEIGEWVFQEAIASIEQWRREFGSVIEVSINNSPIQFEQAGICQWMERFLDSGLPRESIAVEITEGLLVSDSDQVRGCLKQLRDIGAKVSIDDFGTGFSALSYLKHFDVDYLKIDKSFIDSLIDDDSDRALTEAIVDMAHKLGIETIAEGVETRAQRDLLAGFGCDYLQGFLYSPAVPRESFSAMIEPQAAS